MGESLKKALSDIEKEFGKGTIITFSNEIDNSIKRIPSGSIGLDAALGGGWPQGRIIEVFGPESSGKCLTENSYILTSQGYKKLGEIFEEGGLELLTTDKEVEVKYSLINAEGERENTTHFVYNSKRTCYRITTASGFIQERTYKHPLLTISENGHLVWKWVGEIKSGDYLLHLRKPYFGERQCDPDLAYGLGLLIADGYLGQEEITVSNDDPDVINFIESKLSDSLGLGRVKLSYREENKCGTHSLGYSVSSQIPTKEIYKKYDLKPGVAKDKFIPKWVRELNKEGITYFLRGYFDSESCITGETLEVASASFELLYQVKLLLSQFGIIGRLKKLPPVKNYEDRNYWGLYLTGIELEKFIKEIGTNSSKQRINQEKFLNREITQVQTNVDSIPYIDKLLRDLFYQQKKRTNEFSLLIEDLRYGNVRCTHTRLKKILDLCDDKSSILYQQLQLLQNYYFDPVISIEEIGEMRTFDFAMESSHTFIADGLVNHNTTLTLHAIAEAHKLGKKVAFIDAEHAFDPVYAEGVGIDVYDEEKFLFSQPSSGEEALSVAEKLIKSGEIELIVIDSVAALTPKSELEGDFGDSKMGLQARMMSQAMRKLVGVISNTKCTVFFINQLRDNIGVMYGPSEVTTGGNALKFYASVRCEVRRVSQEKDKEGMVVSNRTRVKVVKNKTYPPFRQTEFSIEFGVGIDKYKEILLLAADMEIVKKAGAWYSYKDTKLGNGVDNVVVMMKDNPDLVEEMEKEVKMNLGLE